MKKNGEQKKGIGLSGRASLCIGTTIRGHFVWNVFVRKFISTSKSRKENWSGWSKVMAIVLMTIEWMKLIKSTINLRGTHTHTRAHGHTNCVDIIQMMTLFVAFIVHVDSIHLVPSSLSCQIAAIAIYSSLFCLAVLAWSDRIIYWWSAKKKP